MEEGSAEPHAGAPFVCPDPAIGTALTEIKGELSGIHVQLGAGAKEMRRLANATEDANHRTTGLESWRTQLEERDRVNNEWLERIAQKDERAAVWSRWQWGLMVTFVTAVAATVGSVVATVW